MNRHDDRKHYINKYLKSIYTTKGPDGQLYRLNGPVYELSRYGSTQEKYTFVGFTEKNEMRLQKKAINSHGPLMN